MALVCYIRKSKVSGQVAFQVQGSSFYSALPAISLEFITFCEIFEYVIIFLIQQ